MALIGSNGAGKSTVLRAITGMIPAKGQDITFAGQHITGWAAGRIHKSGTALSGG